MSEPVVPDDQATRDCIVEELDKTLFVEAGAGTGKTTSLVGRILALITGDEKTRIPISQIAAITFTEKAAAELRNRIRAEINEQLAGALDQESIEILQDALAGLDGAAISTLHSFARRLLDEHPLEADLPPSFETLDEIANQVEFNQSWDAFVDEMLADEDNKDWLFKLNLRGVGITHMKEVARKFTDNSDLLGWRKDNHTADLANRSEEIIKLASELDELKKHCEDSEDKLLEKFAMLPSLVEALSACGTDTERLRVLLDKQFVISKRKVGKNGNWQCEIDDVRNQFLSLRESCEEFVKCVTTKAVGACIEQLRKFAVGAAAERKGAGRLNFHDQLVVCRDLLRSPQHGLEVRKVLHHRYTNLLLDEFHDTDPIQIEIAALLATPPSGKSVGDWRHLTTKPGQLFFVGDPKQSIYRFRRADVELYHEAREWFGAELGKMLELNVNFRTVKPVMDWVNHTFDWLMQPEESPDLVDLQARYAPLKAVRPAVALGPPVTIMGAEAHEKPFKQHDVREREALDVGGAIVAICEQGWTVEDRHTGEERPAKLDDITILIPTRASLPYLEDALERRRIPYLLESSSFVWSNRVIRDLMMCLRAIADPTNELATVSALRSPIYGCGDDDLYMYKVDGHGIWDYREVEAKSGHSGPVESGLVHLKELHALIGHQTPAELIERLVNDRQVLEQATASTGVREQWRHVRFLVDQARAWSESQQSGLRRFLAWANEQADDNSRTSVSVLPELDDDAVHVMTMHASKGLEFPIVILAGLQETIRTQASPGTVGFVSKGVLDDEPPAVRLRKGVETDNYEGWSEREREAEHFERVRKLYVACTRSRDHLVVSLHRSSKSSEEKPAMSSAQLLSDVPQNDEQPADERLVVKDFSGRDGEAEYLPSKFIETPASTSKRPERDQWDQNREQALAATRRSAWLSASSIANKAKKESKSDEAETDTEQDDLDVELDTETAETEEGTEVRSRSGRGGTPFGQAVHGVLERLDLAQAAEAASDAGNGDVKFNTGLTKLAKSQADTEGVTELAAEVEKRVRSLLADPTMVAAVGSRHWQEIYVGALVASPNESGGPDSSGAVVDGFIDLLYEDPDSSNAAEPDLVVLDFKTASKSDKKSLKSLTDGYSVQGATYAYCVQKATGRTVSRVEFAYLTEKGTEIHAVEGEELEKAIAKVVAIAEER